MKNIVVIEGKSIKNRDDFHKIIAHKLDLPSYYGENLDALWEVLTEHIDTNLKLIWKDHLISKENLGEYFDRIIGVFNDLKAECSEFELVLD